MSELTWETCPFRATRNDSELILAPIEGTEDMLLVAVAWPHYIIPFGDRVVTVDELHEYASRKRCPPKINAWMCSYLTNEQIVEVARYATRIARMHASIAHNTATDAAENAAAENAAAAFVARAAAARVDVEDAARAARDECYVHVIAFANAMRRV